MKTVPYSIHVDEDVAEHLERHKKTAGKKGSRGEYVSRAVRSYEAMIDEKQAIKDELRSLEQSVNDMRNIARRAYITKNRFMRMFQMAMRGEEISDKVPEGEEWFKADRELSEAIGDLDA